MNILLVAAPGAGKGSLSNLLKERNGFIQISAGDVLREEISSGSELGAQLKSIVDSGVLVDDAKLKELMMKKFESLGDDVKLIMDGYPRTIKQIDDFLEIFDKFNKKLNHVFWLDVDKETALQRALGRMNCPKCGKDYNKFTESLRPKQENICDICGCELSTRKDDNVESYEKRFQTYLNETEPLIEVFKARGLVEKIDSSKTPEYTYEQVVKYLGE